MKTCNQVSVSRFLCRLLNKRLFTDVIDDASGENLSSSNNQSCFGQQEDDIKTSEPVADEIGEFV